jgi:putative endonuclease
VNELVKPPVALKKRKLSSKQQQQHNTALGDQGEQRAVRFLSQKNFSILHTNLIINSVEVDIIALDQTSDELVFIEVKTRKSDYFGDPTAAINFRKLYKLRKAAAHYLLLYPSTKPVRIDSIAVLPDTIYHYENISV